MTVSLIATYAAPTDPDHFDAYFRDVHTPLVLAVPGLESLRVNRIEKHLMGPDTPYMIVEMAFRDRAAFDTAMASPENKAAGRDTAAFAKGIISLMVSETGEASPAAG